MKRNIAKTIWPGSILGGCAVLSALFLLVLLTSSAWAFSLNVVGSDGQAVTGYRWLVEEDGTHASTPGVSEPEPLAINFHTSYMTPVASGDNTTSTGILVDPAKPYYVSVLPFSGYTIGGTHVAPGQSSVTVTVNKLPLPTAQITIFVFEDNHPINNAPDLPQEQGLGGFSIIVEDAAGRYGQAGGQIMTDAYGNPLGTEYNPDGSVLSMGDSTITTDADGAAIVKNLSPGKYGIQVVPPAGLGWTQTSTLEGTKVIDAWVKANEPPYFAEFGAPGVHVSIGFVKPMNDTTVLNGGSTISGTIVNLHLSRPPNTVFESGEPFKHTTPWVGLNDLAAGLGRGVYAARANPDGSFAIPNVPPGNYQLVIWDDFLDLLFASMGVTVSATGGDLILGDIPVFQWFAGLWNYVFFDANGNGFMDDGETGIPGMGITIRFRDGTIYKSAATDPTGFAPFYEMFPFFNWLVAEVDFARLKATGATVVVDAGGPLDVADPWSFGGVLTPQPQPDPANIGQFLPYRTETGPVLTQGFQAFLGQTSVIQWGKKGYDPGENGGISGIVFYATTRAEDDPRLAGAEEWEPGIPRVQVNLYRDANADGVIDDENGDGIVTLADIDNFPFSSSGRPFPGPEDIDRNGNSVFDLGDAIQITTTDSWDDNLPTDCPGDPSDPFYNNGKCYDGLRNFNQVRPGLFDGGYAFDGITAGTYIVEAVPPRSPFGQSYETAKEEDRNVDFGDSYTQPTPLLIAATCVGDPHLVPAVLSLFPEAGVAAPFAGQTRPLCDRKQVALTNGQNAAADFFMFTQVPISGHIVGIILDDLANEFDPNSPQFGEKYAPPWVPVSIRDWTGREISRVYSDEWGAYNTLVPSTYTNDRPIPSGVSPNMITVCLNDPGPIKDPVSGQLITDPFYNRQYSQFCYTFQYMPGATTYLDTPLLPIAAFAGANQFPLDCEFPDGTPKIYSVSGPQGGPYVADPQTAGQITIVSEGTVSVPNPAYDGRGGTHPRTIQRDYGFGTDPGTVTIGGQPLQDIVWTAGSISATVPAGTNTGQLVVTRGDNGLSTPLGVTVTVGPASVRHVAPGSTIQEQIDAASPGDLILVPPGSYEELVIMSKPVRLQGWGAGSVVISAIKSPAEKLQNWRIKAQGLIDSGAVDLLPGQTVIKPTEEGPGIIVLARNAPVGSGGYGLATDGRPNAGIDGFTITGADFGGGILVNGYAHYLEIGNNRIIGNQGALAGGIRLGQPQLTVETVQGLDFQSAFNDHIRIHHNHITQNGSLGGFGGGLSLATGSDAYMVSENYICGNLGLGSGGGIGHIGVSDGGRIEKNTIVFNQSFNQGQSVSGGGIFIGGGAALGGPGSLSPGAGSVSLVSNLIQGNAAGAGDGGGLSLGRVNGRDVAENPGNPDNWYTVDIFNNMIVNNIAGLAGGGITMQDTVKINIINNTIANNDSTATAGEAFAPGSRNQSIPQPAGVVSRAHSATLAAAAPEGFGDFSNPRLENNIIRHNRSFYFFVDETQNPVAYLLLPSPGKTYWDLEVLGTATPASLNPMYCDLTDAAGYDPSNTADDPLFVAEYFNAARSSIIGQEPTTGIQPAPAFDEGGNFIDIQFGPLSLFDPATGERFGDYHLQATSPVIDAADGSVIAEFSDLSVDFDGDPRVAEAGVDIGADEYVGPEPCQGDFDADGDVDGLDLFEFTERFISGNNQISLGTFAANFGRNDCP